MPGRWRRSRKRRAPLRLSCSQAVSKELFRTTCFSATHHRPDARSRILHQPTQPADHPINIYHPEGEYLKGIGTLRRINPLSNRIQIVDMERETIVREFLDRHKIPVRHLSPPASPTIEEAKAHWREDGSKHCKKPLLPQPQGRPSLFGLFRLRPLAGDSRSGTPTAAGQTHLRLAAARMERYLGLEPGSVSPFGLINDAEHHVHLFLDRHLQMRQFEFPPQRLPSHGGHFPPRIRTLPLPGRKYVRIPRPLRLTRLKSTAPCE